MKSIESKFEHLGYFKEYYLNCKFIGTLKCDKDRDTFGYFGRQKEVLKSNITLENKKVLKQGLEIETMLFPLCGKIKSLK